MATLATALLLAAASGCQSGSTDAPPGLVTALNEISDEYDAYYEDHQAYPDPFSSDHPDMDQYERWNIVTYYGENYGYCIEGDDEQGTWHLRRDATSPAEGECPR